jgi:hypothetical protein
MIAGFEHLTWKIVSGAVVALICISLIFIGCKANQPMAVADAPKGMTYIQFMQDRFDAARIVQPARFGWGMMLYFALIGPIYSVDYPWAIINPNGFFCKNYCFYGDQLLDFAAGTDWFRNGTFTMQMKLALPTEKWGLMLVDYVYATNPNPSDQPEPPKLLLTLNQSQNVFLPLLFR